MTKATNGEDVELYATATSDAVEVRVYRGKGRKVKLVEFDVVKGKQTMRLTQRDLDTLKAVAGMVPEAEASDRA